MFKPQGPLILTLCSFPSVTAWDSAHAKKQLSVESLKGKTQTPYNIRMKRSAVSFEIVQGMYLFQANHTHAEGVLLAYGFILYIRNAICSH